MGLARPTDSNAVLLHISDHRHVNGPPPVRRRTHSHGGNTTDLAPLMELGAAASAASASPTRTRLPGGVPSVKLPEPGGSKYDLAAMASGMVRIGDPRSCNLP